MSSLSVAANRRDGAVEHEAGPYILSRLNVDIALSEDGSRDDIHITCVEYWNGNLYVGTSAAEVLHYVLIPAGNGPGEQEQLILASRLLPAEDSGTDVRGPGVQQLLILANVDKACIVCNGSLTFYSLPELSPLFTTTKLTNCLWVGGLDQDEEGAEAPKDGVVIMICQKSRIRLVKIGDLLKKVRVIELGNCSTISRRGNIACVADATTYSLLDVVERQRIPLFDVGSAIELGNDEKSHPQSDTTVSASSESAHNNANAAERVAKPAMRGDLDGSNTSTEQNATQSDQPTRIPPPHPQLNPEAIAKTDTTSFPPRISSLGSQAAPAKSTTESVRRRFQLHPHIASPSSEEFLLTTGTSPDEPGVGMFVNLDGDVVRGTIEFSRYPESICVDVPDTQALESGTVADEGFVLAVIERTDDEKSRRCLEVQTLDPNPRENGGLKHWLEINDVTDTGVGLRLSASQCETLNRRVADILRLRSLEMNTRQSGNYQTENRDPAHTQSRERAEAQFVNRLSTVQARVLVWAKDSVWWALRNPMLVQLDTKLSGAIEQHEGQRQSTNLSSVEEILVQVRALEGRTELEFLGLRYIRQKASLMLFMDLISRTLSNMMTYERDRRIVEGALSEGEIDARIVLAILPVLRHEVIQGTDGIWTQNGLKDLIDSFMQQHDLESGSLLDDDVLQLIKRYLQIWRRKKGFGSVADETQVFQSVDAALLHTLLLLDSKSPKGSATSKASTRSELNNVVDHGLDCFERAIELLESFHRLYILSRLYQYRKMSSLVLATWRRIIEGERDDGGEFVDGEQEVRKYLGKINDADLVEEYGAWLASRNPALGVRVFADNGSKIKFAPPHAVEILKLKAPNAVKDYLEHLVFDKNLAAYANDLITHYLNTVLTHLSTSPETRSALLDSYTTYRALASPKPTYIHFFADNFPPTPWRSARLRLLNLLGASHTPSSNYDIPAILALVAPYTAELVPETIVLCARQAKHKDAIHLLVQALGDFDTAVSYCVLGGESTYSPLSGARAAPSREEQMALFAHLLGEFLGIEDVEERVAQAGALLERFAGWFDVGVVLELVPDTWSVELLSTFLESALRRLVAERNETAIARALTNVENLTAAGTLIEKVDALGPTVVHESSV